MEHGGSGGGAWAVLTGLATLRPWGIADGEDTRTVDLEREGRARQGNKERRRRGGGIIQGKKKKENGKWKEGVSKEGEERKGKRKEHKRRVERIGEEEREGGNRKSI